MNQSEEKALLETLEEHEHVRMMALAETLDAHPITIDQQCYELQLEGYIRQTSGGVYRITDAGREYLATFSE